MGKSANGRCSVKKEFFFDTSPCPGHWLTCSGRKGHSRRGPHFFSDSFTREKNGKNLFSKEFSCSCAINNFRTGMLCRILNYSAEHLKIPDNFLRKQTNTSKEYIPCYPRKIFKPLQKHLILPSILPGCFEFVLQDYTPEHVNIPRKKTNF